MHETGFQPSLALGRLGRHNGHQEDGSTDAESFHSCTNTGGAWGWKPRGAQAAAAIFCPIRTLQSWFECVRETQKQATAKSSISSRLRMPSDAGTWGFPAKASQGPE